MNVRKQSKFLSVLIKLFKLFLDKGKKALREETPSVEPENYLNKRNVVLDEKEKVDYKEMENLLKTNISTENIL